MDPILFYFANSPAGGGVTRLSKYLENIDRKDCRFLGDARCQSVFTPGDVRLEFLRTPAWKRIFDENYHVRKLNLSESRVFSYGAPILPKCRFFVLHINNALPFTCEPIELSRSLRLKMHILLKRLYRSAAAADLITVESAATRELVAKKWGARLAAKCEILSNGVDDLRLPGPPEIAGPYFLAVGTYPYKRLYKAYAAYREALKLQEDLKFVIVGGMSASEIERPGVINYPYLSNDSVRQLMRFCTTYISMSQIENCSVALLEAIFEKRSIICSAIPSHVESLKKFGYLIEFKGDILHAEPAVDAILPTSWRQISEQTLSLLGG